MWSVKTFKNTYKYKATNNGMFEEVSNVQGSAHRHYKVCPALIVKTVEMTYITMET